MSFVEQTKKMIIVLSIAATVGLLVILITKGDIGGGKLIGFEYDERRMTVMRLFLMIYEGFWLFAIAYGFYKLSKKATKKASEESLEKLEIFESKFMKIMVVILLISAIVTLLGPALFGDGLPQYNTKDEVDEIVYVSTRQFSFAFTHGDFVGNDTVILRTNVDYHFALSTNDTTHGFGIYSPDLVFLVQAQIVPGYVTNLKWNFDETGTYTIRCMEYCGTGHHVMEQYITVEDA